MTTYCKANYILTFYSCQVLSSATTIPRMTTRQTHTHKQDSERIRSNDLVWVLKEKVQISPITRAIRRNGMRKWCKWIRLLHHKTTDNYIAYGVSTGYCTQNPANSIHLANSHHHIHWMNTCMKNATIDIWRKRTKQNYMDQKKLWIRFIMIANCKSK